MASNSQLYEYQPLTSPSHLRALILQPSRQFNAPVQCSLREISIEAVKDGSESYEAVSYVWGSPTRDQEIFCDAKSLFITPNCLVALRYLRQVVETRVLWIDAICIDQNNLMERNQQVTIMGDIYRFAARVLIWLGTGKKNECRYIRHLHEGNQPSSLYKRLVLRPRAMRTSVLKNDWFHRVWKLQEYLRSQEALIMMGSTSVRFSILAKMKEKLHEFDDFHVDTRCREMEECRTFLAKPDTETSNQMWALRTILEEIVVRSCHDQRDKIFGIHSLLMEIGIQGLKIDYTTDYKELYEAFVIAVINRFGCLNFLWTVIKKCNHRSVDGLPSWVPDLRHGSDSVLSPAFRGYNSDHEHDGHGFFFDHWPGHLTVKGRLIGSLDFIGIFEMYATRAGADFDDCLTLYRRIIMWRSFNPVGLRRIGFFQWLFATLFCHVRHQNSPDITCPLDYYRPILQRLLTELIRMQPRAVRKMSKLRNYSVFLSMGDKIGKSSSTNIQKGDVFALLHRFPTGIILRPYGDNYQVVGEAVFGLIPEELWPVTGDEEGVEKITLA